MDRSRPAETPSMLPVIGALFLGFVLMDILKLWFSPNVSYALGAFIGTLSLGAAKSLRLSWRRVILGALGIAAAVFAVGVVRDLLFEWFQHEKFESSDTCK